MDKPDDRENGEDAAEPHTIESVEFTLSELTKALQQIKVSIELMQTAPKIDTLRIHRESSRVNGLRRVVSWADALRDAVSKTKDDLLKMPVSDSKNGTARPKKKTL